MEDLLAARSQMAMSLAFHIVFASAGIAMPLFMVVAEVLGRTRRDERWIELAKRWSKGTAILFAVGAVSGTVLSFELGLLFPRFMRYAGPIVGMPFSLEGFAFFLEAIFLGIYLYGWKRVPPAMHVAAGVLVLASGLASAAFVLTVNAWMNTPTGFTMADGELASVDPWAAMLNPAAATEIQHMTIAAFVAVGFAVSAIHARALLRDPEDPFHRRALALALSVACVAAIAQPISGDLAARHIAVHQPVKLAAAEGHFHTERGAALHLGGWPDERTGETRFALSVPRGLSFLAFHDPDAEVRGLDAFPRADWPPVAVVHIAFDVMVGIGSALAGLAMMLGGMALRRRALPTARWVLWSLVLAGPLGFVALEAGWVVTEVGRQPWIVHGVMRTADAVTPMPGLTVPFVAFTLLYCVLGLVVATMLRRHVLAARPEARPWHSREPDVDAPRTGDTAP